MTTKPKPKRRHYSRAFKLSVKGKTLAISQCPPRLLASFAAKVEREHLSQRALVLGWIRNWTAGRRPDDDTK